MLAKTFYLYFSLQFLKSLCNFLFISVCLFGRIKIVSLYSICHLFPIPSRISSFQLVTWINPVQSTFWKKKCYLKTYFCNFFQITKYRGRLKYFWFCYPFTYFWQHNQVYMKMFFLLQLKLISWTFNWCLLFNSNMSSPLPFALLQMDTGTFQ